MALEGRHRVEVVQVSIYIELETILGKEKKMVFEKEKQKLLFQIFQEEFTYTFFFSQ